MLNKVFTFVLLILSGAGVIELEANEHAAGWQTLFADKSPSWSFTGDASWTFDDSVLIGKDASENSFILTNSRYANFHLKAEFYPVSETNSGIYFRCEKDKLTADDCYEANIADKHKVVASRTGSLVGHVEPLVQSETIGHWNTYEILAENAHIQIWTNGVKTADYESADISEGVIALQLFKAGEVRFRNVLVKEL